MYAATLVRGWSGGSNSFTQLMNVGRRLYSSPRNLPPADEIEWWMVEGRPISVNAIRNVKKKGEDEERLEADSRRLYHDRIHHLSRVKSGYSPQDRKQYWDFYLKVYAEARDEWEKLVWDSPRKHHRPITEHNFFDTPLVTRRKKRKDGQDKKPFSMEEIQAAIRDNVRPLGERTDSNIEYRTASDSKWPF